MWPKALPPSCPGMRPKRDVECCLINILTRKHKLGIFQRCTRCRPGHSPLYSSVAMPPTLSHSVKFIAWSSLLTNCCQQWTFNWFWRHHPPSWHQPLEASRCLVNLDVDLNQPWTKSSTVQITTDIKSSWHFSFLAETTFVCIFVITNPIHIRINDRVLCLLHISTQIFR